MLRSIWAGTKRALSALDKVLAYLVPVMFFCVGGFMLYASAFERIPPPEEMVLVTGPVEYYSVERSRGDIPNKINFKMWNDDTPYWTNEIDQDWVSGRLDGTTIRVAFHIEPGPVFRLGTVKTFGLSVNGRMVKRLEDDIAGETTLLRYVFPVLALMMAGLGYWKWPRRPQLTFQPDGTMAEARIDKGFELSWGKLTPRRQFIRSLWTSGFAILFVLLVKPEFLWILGTAIGCSIWSWSMYRAWRSDVKQQL